MFAEDGVDAQIDDVARRPASASGTVYRHFPTKEALLVELVRQKFRLFAAAAREALERDGEPFAVLADLLRRNAETCARDAGIQHALAGAGEHIWVQAQAEQRELDALTDELIARAQQAGTMRPDVRRQRHRDADVRRVRPRWPHRARVSTGTGIWSW